MINRAALSLLSSFAVACGGHDPELAAPAPVAEPEVTPQVELARLLGRLDRTPPGPFRDALAARIDRVAGQRYASWSRLYWHRDLDAAMAEARATGRPILSLRMLGRLDRDLSCANSRFFRVALYANREVSRVLRDQYVLHWSSERPVPVARIDFGDGRVMERTLAGNSAHYILDQRGRPVDVLPGLYGPALFLDALGAIRPVAVRAALVADHHRREAARAAERFASLGRIQAGGGGSSIANAEVRAMSKAFVELPVVEGFELGAQGTLADAGKTARASAFWDAVGAVMAEKVAPSRLDEQSRALFAALGGADWHVAPTPSAGVAQRIAAFEAVMTRDAAYNELVLHQAIHAQMASDAAASFESLNRWVYASLFLTPEGDPWLGMATPDVFTGLPGDGVVMSPATAPRVAGTSRVAASTDAGARQR